MPEIYTFQKQQNITSSYIQHSWMVNWHPFPSQNEISPFSLSPLDLNWPVQCNRVSVCQFSDKSSRDLAHLYTTTLPSHCIDKLKEPVISEKSQVGHYLSTLQVNNWLMQKAQIQWPRTRKSPAWSSRSCQDIKLRDFFFVVLSH